MPQETWVGTSHINKAFFDLTGVSILWYEITDWLGLTALLAGCVFALAGLVQWIKRKHILKVDKRILLLGCLYVLVIGLYLLFESVVINCRPLNMPGCSSPEASFPSSHTMLVCVVMGSACRLSSSL